MIDTVTLFVDKQREYNNKSLRKINNLKTFLNNTTGQIVESGKLNNLRTKKTDHGILVTGSLPVYYYGNNLQTLTLFQTKEILYGISEILGFNLREAKVFRMDIGYNLMMNELVAKYLTCIGDLSYFKKSVFNDFQTVRLWTSLKSLLFYNKTLEMQNKKIPLPVEFENCNNKILRYELQFKRRLKNEFGFIDSITCDHLFNRDFMNKALSKWKKNYFAIRKINSPLQNIDFSKGNKYLIKSLASVGLNVLGYDEIMGMIQSEKNNLERMAFSRLKKSVRELLNVSETENAHNYISELDEKINSVSIE